jgi:hypothetical protein
MFLPTQEFLESYHRDLLEQARLSRLLRERGSHLPKAQHQLLLKAGDSLIALGTRLKTLSQAPAEQPQLPMYKISQQQ